jgi:hypothetical protein
MVDVVALHAGVLEALNAVPHITGYDGNVPANPPADTDGYVLPYWVLWPSPGIHPAEALSPGCATGPELDWLLQVTCVGGDSIRCLQAVTLVRGALTGLTPATGAGYLRQEPVNTPMQIDRDVTPPRHFLPLFFRCLTA